MKKLILVFAIAVSAFAQSESQIESDEVKRVGSHINCQCGGCKDDVNCMMSGGQCHFCKPTRTKIFNMQQSGMSDGGIIAALKKEFGENVFRPDPSSIFWIVPYLSIGLGALLVGFILMRMRGHATRVAVAGPAIPEDPSFARYRAAIEKDTDRLE
jgi:cytochrome c-type biogenesis protein CcmH/NrfF